MRATTTAVTTGLGVKRCWIDDIEKVEGREIARRGNEQRRRRETEIGRTLMRAVPCQKRTYEQVSASEKRARYLQSLAVTETVEMAGRANSASLI